MGTSLDKLTKLNNVPSDRALIFAATFLRALATGMAGVLLGVYLPRLGFSPAVMGTIVGAGLAGGAIATLFATLSADRLGRRRFLAALAAVGALGGAVAGAASSAWVVGVSAFIGMMNGMGRDRGAGLVLEQAMLPAASPDAERTRAFAWYNVLQDAGHALGGLAAGLPVVLRRLSDVRDLESLRLTVALYAVLILLSASVYPFLSSAVEAAEGATSVRLSRASRRVLWKISSLFALDSLAGGFLTTALLSFFFYERFGVNEGIIGPLFFVARVANAFSHLGAAWLGKRFGLLNTMVFTHVPSSLLLATVGFAPSFRVAAALFLVREGLVEMDVPTRQSYVMAVVEPDERTFASGVTHLVRISAWAVAPFVAGWCMQGFSLGTPLVVGAAMKLVYDALLFVAFRNLRPPEEADRGAGGVSIR